MSRLNRVSPFVLAGAAAMVAGVLSGCGSDDGLPRQALSGRVTLDGEAVSKAWITFRPVSNDGVTSAASQIEDGKYSVSRGEGLIPGKYRVTITKPEGPAPGAAADDGAASNAAGKNAKTKKVVSPFPVIKELIPLKYNKETTLFADIKEGQPNSFDFPLTSK